MLKGNVFWNENVKILKSYPYVNEDKNCDVLVVGGGIAGALTAYLQSKTGANVIIVDKNIIGYESTLTGDGTFVSTFNFEGNKKQKILPKKTIDKCNNLLKNAMLDIESIIYEILKDDDCKKYINELGLKHTDLLYFSDKITNKMSMYKLFEKLGSENPEVEYLEEDPIINLRTGILIPNEGITLNPYVFTQLIFIYLSKLENVRIYENTKVIDIHNTCDEVCSITYNNFKINSKYVILTSGISVSEYITNIEFNLNKVFTIVTDKINELDETYLNIIAKDENGINISFTKDKRIVLSGEVSRNIDKEVNINKFSSGKYKKLYITLNKLFNLDEVKITNCFYGNYLETKDGLPVIDELEDIPNVYCNVGVGRNGILFSMIGANCLRDISKKYHIKDMYIFRENRDF